MKARVAALTALALLASGVLAQSAAADTAPVLACGSTIVTSCSETAHFDQVNQWLTPPGPAAGCPAELTNDYALMVGSGNGVEHNNLNKAGDFWSTMTFTGEVTITAYSPSNVEVILDDQGDVVSATITGPPDDVITGHATQWVGVSDNKQSGTFGLTFSINGIDQNGVSVTVHGDQHANWTPGSVPFAGPPQHAKASFRC